MIASCTGCSIMNCIFYMISLSDIVTSIVGLAKVTLITHFLKVAFDQYPLGTSKQRTRENSVVVPMWVHPAGDSYKCYKLFGLEYGEKKSNYFCLALWLPRALGNISNRQDWKFGPQILATKATKYHHIYICLKYNNYCKCQWWRITRPQCRCDTTPLYYHHLNY